MNVQKLKFRENRLIQWLLITGYAQTNQIVNKNLNNSVPVIIEGLRERTKDLDIYLSGVLFQMFCLWVEGKCQILVF